MTAPAATPTPRYPHAGPLGWSDYADIARAARSLKPVRRAERIGVTGGWLMLASGLLTIPFSLDSGVRLALGVALTVLGLREIALARSLRSLEPTALKRLALNQIGLACAFTAFAAVSLTQAPPPSQVSAQLAQASPDLASMSANIERFAHRASYLVLIAGTWIAQGAQAAFYARTAQRLRKAYANTPMWVMRVHAAAWSGKAPDTGLAFAADAPAAPTVANEHPVSGDSPAPRAAA